MPQEKDDVFHVDPLLSTLFRGQQDTTFSVGLVANWPPPSTLQDDYAFFCQEVQRHCFHEDPAFYLLPFHSLHITVATLFPNTPKPDVALRKEVDIEQLLVDWKEVLLAACQLPEWPQKPLQLEIQSAQIGSHAGIFFWKEQTGGLNRIRDCLLHEVKNQSTKYLMKSLRIPNIIHTSFVRYTAIPSNGKQSPREMNEMLQRHVPVQEIFAKQTIRVNHVDMVDCKIYLQSPPEEHPVTLGLSLEPRKVDERPETNV